MFFGRNESKCTQVSQDSEDALEDTRHPGSVGMHTKCNRIPNSSNGLKARHISQCHSDKRIESEPQWKTLRCQCIHIPHPELVPYAFNIQTFNHRTLMYFSGFSRYSKRVSSPHVIPEFLFDLE